MIEMGKSYRTRDGRGVRIYAVDGGGAWPVHGAIRNNASEWITMTWRMDGAQVGSASNNTDLVESDPHGILPRHRALLASVFQELNHPKSAEELRSDKDVGALRYDVQAALIALAKQDQEKTA